MPLTQRVCVVPSVPATQFGVPENCPDDYVPTAQTTGDGGIIVELYENIIFKDSKEHS
jgi:hypothetical protein